MDIVNASEKTRMRKEKIPARENSGTEIFFLISSERKQEGAREAIATLGAIAQREP